MLIDYIIQNFNTTMRRLKKDKRYISIYRKISLDSLLELLNQNKFNLPKLVKIPKSDGGLRDIFIYSHEDNLLLKFVNDYLYKEYSDLISNNVYSYKRNISVYNAQKEVFNYGIKGKVFLKVDLKKYFNSPKLNNIQPLLNKLGLDTNLFLSLFENRCIYKEKEIEYSMGLLPGCPISAFLSNAFLKELDDYLSSNYSFYIRYSDDFLLDITNKDVSTVLSEIKIILSKYNLEINEKKIDVLANKITFLGADITYNYITISKNKFKLWKSKIKSLSKKYCKYKVDADTRVKYFLCAIYNEMYKIGIKTIDNLGFIGYIFNTITTNEILKEMDYYILDKCRYVVTGKTNHSALQKGYTTIKLESLGFKSTITMYNYWTKNKLIYLYECKKLIDSFFIKDCKDVVVSTDKTDDLFDYCLKNETIIDFRNNRIISDNKLIAENNTVYITIEKDFGLVNKQLLLEIIREANKRYSPYLIDKAGAKDFLRIPYNRYGYYDLTDKTTYERSIMLGLLNYLDDNNLIDLEFNDNSLKYKIIGNIKDIFFIKENKNWGISNA